VVRQLEQSTDFPVRRAAPTLTLTLTLILTLAPTLTLTLTLPLRRAQMRLRLRLPDKTALSSVQQALADLNLTLTLT